MCSVKEGDGRSLNVAIDSTLEVAAVLVFIADDFETTMSTSDDFNSVADHLENVVTVLFMYGIMWGFGFSGIFFCSIRQKRLSRVISTSKADLEEKTKFAMQSKSGDIVRTYLTAYINETFPVRTTSILTYYNCILITV